MNEIERTDRAGLKNAPSATTLRLSLINLSFLYLIIDEHTGEAGFQTRLEAFIDTLS